MKVFLAILAVVSLAYAEDTVDWSNVKPAWTRLPLPPNLVLPENWSEYWVQRLAAGGRIVGGEEAVPNSIPYQVGMLITTSAGTFFCGGSLISQRYVLTAAHCLDDASQIQVRLGAHRINENESSQVRFTTTSYTQHAEWNLDRLINDIAIVELPAAVELNENIQLVSLPSYSDQSNNFAGDAGRISGWGLDSDSSDAISPILREVDVNIITNFICNIQYLGIIQSSHVCTSGSGGRGSCDGDSGGPLVVGDIQVGIVSFGLAIGCEVGWPSAFARVTSYLDWIEANSDVVIAA